MLDGESREDDRDVHDDSEPQSSTSGASTQNSLDKDDVSDHRHQHKQHEKQHDNQHLHHIGSVHEEKSRGDDDISSSKRQHISPICILDDDDDEGRDDIVIKDEKDDRNDDTISRMPRGEDRETTHTTESDFLFALNLERQLGGSESSSSSTSSVSHTRVKTAPFSPSRVDQGSDVIVIL
jgi:hypothetical protein